MKLKLLVGSLLLAGFLAGSASAQGVHAGLEAGTNFSNFIGEQASAIDGSLLGFVGGGFVDFDLAKQFGIRVEALYTQKGTQSTTTAERANVDYVEIPVLLKASLGTPGVNPSLFLGASVGLNVLANYAEGNESAPIDDVNAAEFNIIGGAQVNFDKFFVNGRYELGLSNITTESNIQNGTITFMAGYSFL